MLKNNYVTNMTDKLLVKIKYLDKLSVVFRLNNENDQRFSTHKLEKR